MPRSSRSWEHSIRIGIHYAYSCVYWLLAGKGLILSIAVTMVLRFGFGTKTVLITNQCFSYCWTKLTQHVTQGEGWVWARGWERTHLGHLSWADQRVYHSIPCNLMLSNSNWGEDVSGEVSITWRLADHHSTCGRRWAIAFVSLTYFWLFFFHILKVYFDPWVSSLSLFLFSPHWGEKVFASGQGQPTTLL